MAYQKFQNAEGVLQDIKTETIDQGVTLDAIAGTSVTTDTTLDNLSTEALAQGVVQDSQYTEQLAQGVVQDTLEDLLTQILIQLKILTVHQEKASDEIFTEEDITL